MNLKLSNKTHANFMHLIGFTLFKKKKTHRDGIFNLVKLGFDKQKFL